MYHSLQHLEPVHELARDKAQHARRAPATSSSKRPIHRLLAAARKPLTHHDRATYDVTDPTGTDPMDQSGQPSATNNHTAHPLADHRRFDDAPT
jgi:hypothetical protein